MTDSNFAFDPPQEYGGGGDYLDQPGTFHVAVANAHDGKTAKGKSIPGFSLELLILAGTVEKCQDLLHTETFFKAKSGAEKFAIKIANERIAAVMIACNLFDPSKNEMPPADSIAKMVNQQFLLTLEVNDYSSTESTKYLQVKFANIFHVDDPRAARFPKNNDYLKLIDANHRKPKDFFTFLDKGKSPAADQSGAADQGDKPLDLGSI